MSEEITARDRCRQSGHPAAGSRQHMMASCHACDAVSWCWSFEYRVGNPSCAACEHAAVCHPEDVDADHQDCLACDYFLTCRSGKAAGGRCLFAEPGGTCACQSSS